MKLGRTGRFARQRASGARPAWKAVVGNQVPVAEAATDSLPNDNRHLVFGVCLAHIVAARKLRDIAVKMLLGELVEGALIPALEHRPERLDPVDVRHAVHEFLGGVIDRFMRVFRHPGIGAGFVGVEGCARLYMLPHKALQRRCVGLRNAASGNPVGLPVLHAYDCRLADRAAPLQLFPLPVRHILPLLAEKCLIGLR